MSLQELGRAAKRGEMPTYGQQWQKCWRYLGRVTCMRHAYKYCCFFGKLLVLECHENAQCLDVLVFVSSFRSFVLSVLCRPFPLLHMGSTVSLSLSLYTYRLHIIEEGMWLGVPFLADESTRPQYSHVNHCPWDPLQTRKMNIQRFRAKIPGRFLVEIPRRQVPQMSRKMTGGKRPRVWGCRGRCKIKDL